MSDDHYSHTIGSKLNIERPRFTIEIEYSPIIYRGNICRQCKTKIESYKMRSSGFEFKDGKLRSFMRLVARCSFCKSANPLTLWEDL